MKKNDLSALQENCFCFCDEEISREAPFQVPIDIPKGFKVDSAEASAAVTWSTDNLSCVSEPCLIQTGKTEDIGVRYAVRVQGVVRFLSVCRLYEINMDKETGLFLSFIPKRLIKLFIMQHSLTAVLILVK